MKQRVQYSSDLNLTPPDSDNSLDCLAPIQRQVWRPGEVREELRGRRSREKQRSQEAQKREREGFFGSSSVSFECSECCSSVCFLGPEEPVAAEVGIARRPAPSQDDPEINREVAELLLSIVQRLAREG